MHQIDIVLLLITAMQLVIFIKKTTHVLYLFRHHVIFLLSSIQTVMEINSLTFL